MGGDQMPLALPPPPPPPGEEEEQQQQPAAGAVVLQPLESDSCPAVKEDREKASQDQSSSQDMNFLIRAGDSSTDEHIQLFLDKYNLMRGYVHTACCSRNTICGESYYPVGAALSNPEGWTCYVNCILQCVVHTVPLVLKLRKDDHTNACPRGSDEFCWYCSLQFHVAEVIHVYGSVLYPKKFVEHLKLLSENFQWGQHQDAHEFLRCLLDKLDEACVPTPTSSERPSSIVKEVFGGQLKSQLHCPECNYCSDRFEPFLDLNLEVIPMGTVMDALKSFTKIEVFENFGCDGCKSRVSMEKQLKVEQAPEVLVIQLKRFQNFGSDISKIKGKVEYHSELDLNPFMSSPDNKPQKYDLYGVVKHEGVSSNGHYVCYIRSSRTNWFHFDDCKVMKISEVRALDTEAYLLFYMKQGSSPWFSTLIKRENNVLGDIEGCYSSSSSEDDCCPATSSWHNNNDETSMWDDVHEEEDVDRQHNEIIDMQKEKCCEREIQEKAKIEGDSSTHATHPCTSKEDDIKGSDSPAGALLGPVGSNFDSIAEGKCTSKAVVQEEAMRDEPLQQFSMYDKLLEQPLLSLPEASDKEWAVERRNVLSENFHWGKHQDAHEFLRCLLDKLDEACVPPPTSSGRPSSIVKEVFGGQLKSQLHCPECNYCSDRLEPFLDLNLEVIPVGTVMDALKSFTKIEVFENFGCDGCKSRVNMERQLKVEQAPEVLVIQLKQFQNFGSDISKIKSKVEYHSELDLNPFMSSPDNKPLKYDLYGVVKHEGVSSNGHHVCYIRSSRTNWFHFDDCKVMKISKVRALDTEAYLLFYIKQGSPWFSTLIKRENNVSGDIEGCYSITSSEDDCYSATSTWHSDSDETSMWDDVHEEEDVDRQHNEIIDMQKEKCCEREIEGDSSTHATHPCTKEDDIKGSDSPAGALLGPVGSNFDSIAEGKCASKAVVQEEAMRDEPLQHFSMYVKLLDQPLLSLPEASDKEWAVVRRNDDGDKSRSTRKRTSRWDKDTAMGEEEKRQCLEMFAMAEEIL